jgi:hypothetical protein
MAQLRALMSGDAAGFGAQILMLSYG